MINFKLRGIKLFQDDDGRSAFTRLATYDLFIPDMDATISGAVLTWSKERGFSAYAPGAKTADNRFSLTWRPFGKFALQLCEEMQTMFFAVGGQLPIEEEPDYPAIDPDEDNWPEGSPTGRALVASIAAAENDNRENLHAFLGVQEACDRAIA